MPILAPKQPRIVPASPSAPTVGKQDRLQETHSLRPVGDASWQHRSAAAPLRIMMVINAMGRGGAEMQVADVAIELRRRGHTVSVVVLLPFEDFESRLASNGVETLSLHMRQGEARLSAVARFALLVRRWRPDVLHSHQFAATMLARLVRPATRVPALICTSHSLFESSRSRYAAYRLTSRLGDVWTHVSHTGIEVHQRRAAVPTGSIKYTPNGIAVSNYGLNRDNRPAIRRALGATDAFVWLAAGSFRNESKDYETALRAFQIASSANDHSLLVIAGAGRLLEEKKSLAASLGLRDKVRFLGLRDDLPDLMTASDGFVFSSAWESQGLVILEAAASSLPIVATDVGCAREVIVDAGVGRIVPIRRPDLMAHAMMDISKLGPEERKDMGQRARAVVNATFDLDVVVTRWEDIYRNTLSPAGEDSLHSEGSQT